jgi:glycosyltransferase involved in cell wall biosynthesis
MRPRLIVIGPLPPPVHGVAVSTSLVLANPVLQERFRVEHLDTSDHRAGTNMGRWDWTNVGLATRHTAELLRRLTGPRGTVYLPLSQNRAAFLRDSLFIHAAAARGWRVAVHLRGGEFAEFYEGQARAFRSWIRLALARVTSLAVMGSCLRSLFEGIVPSGRIAVVPNGTPDPGTGSMPRDRDTTLFLSNLRRRKGVVEAVEAALIVVRRHPRARFLFVGEWEDAALERTLRARAREGDGRIRFLPAAAGEEKRRLLLTSGALLFPPVRPEGHPRVVLEALSAGLPVVTTNRGAIAETVTDGVTGFVLEHPAPDALAERLLRLLESRPLHERMAEEARRDYLGRFTQERADRRLADWLWHVSSTA